MGKTGDRLSILGYGTMRLPEKNGRIDEARAARQIRHAIDSGVNFVDTAFPYHLGGSEPFLGRALADGYRERVKLCTKLPPWSVRTRGDMDAILNSQLKRLRTGHIDYYLVHSLDGTNWKKMLKLGVLSFLDQAKEDGRIIHAGFSFHGDIASFKKIVDAYDWDVCLIQYNYLDEHNQAGTEGMRYAAEKGMGVMVMEPLRGGNLSKRPPRRIQEIWDGAPVRRSPAEWALRWVWNHPEVTLLLSGMNDEAHIAENLRIADESEPNSLTAEELSTVEKARDAYRELMRVNCTGCRYCVPCPAGVDIPLCFEMYNNRRVFGEGRSASLYYAIRLSDISNETPSFASQCTRCGKCLRHCPQHLPIPDLLDEVVREFEGPTLAPMVWFSRNYLKFQKWRETRKAGAKT
jgi:predicted aldo/keto reductase-like oxidoreductase